MPAGRPTDYRPEFCERVIELGRLGYSHAQIAAHADIDVARKTLYEWADKYPEFSDAITRARDLAQAWFENKGQDGLEKPGFNASLWNKQVTCRFRDDYTETSKQEITGAGGVSLFSGVTIRLVKPE